MLLHTFAKNITEFTYLSNCQYNLLIKSHLNLITVQKNPNYKNIITPFNTWFWEFKYTQLESIIRLTTIWLRFLRGAFLALAGWLSFVINSTFLPRWTLVLTNIWMKEKMANTSTSIHNFKQELKMEALL